MNAAARFKNFVERQQQPTDTLDTVDFLGERDVWLTHLRQLYDAIGDHLGEYIDAGTIALRETSFELNEEGIGIYEARRLFIDIGLQEIALTPVGTLLIGSKGRVDVEGSAGSSRLVLVDSGWADPSSTVRVDLQSTMHRSAPRSIEWIWKIVSRPPAMQLVDFDNDTFFEMLMAVSNG